LKTSSFLLLLLGFVPGEDLFYFLEQAGDHDDHYDPTSEHAISSARGLFFHPHSSLILSPNRLCLIASMFSQMCNAVAACHYQQVFHRDIKPEIFIVMDDCTRCLTAAENVKLLSTSRILACLLLILNHPTKIAAHELWYDLCLNMNSDRALIFEQSRRM
jgi:serine/threonine protein kinase